MRTYKGMSDFHRLHYIESYLSSSQSLYGFCKQNGLPITRFKSWLRIFGVEKSPSPEAMKTSKEPEKQALLDEVSQLRKEMKLLKARLKQAEMARDAYDCMIDLAEAEFNIPIRKNPMPGSPHTPSERTELYGPFALRTARHLPPGVLPAP